MRGEETSLRLGAKREQHGSRKRVGLSGETATLPFSPLFCYLSRLFLFFFVFFLENRTTDTTH
jgi:hypothetical protein